MTILGKKQMSEEDIKLNYITPVILDGWKGHVIYLSFKNASVLFKASFI